jgi:hypothetical protein
MGSNNTSRSGQAAILTGGTLLLLTGLGLTLGPMAVVLSAITLPVPLTLLWLAADVYRSDEHEPARAVARVRLPAHESVA